MAWPLLCYRRTGVATPVTPDESPVIQPPVRAAANERTPAHAGPRSWRPIRTAKLRAMPGRLAVFPALRAWLVGLAVGVLLALPACVGPGLEPPKDRGSNASGGAGIGSFGGSGGSGGSSSGASGNGDVVVEPPSGAGGAGGAGGEGSERVDGGVDGGVDTGDAGLDEDAGALR